MKLNWTITENRMLRATSGDDAYFIYPEGGGWKPAKHKLDAGGGLIVLGATEAMALACAIVWCEEVAAKSDDAAPDRTIARLEDIEKAIASPAAPVPATVEDRLNAIEWFLGSGPKPEGGLRLELHRSFLGGAK